MTPDTIERDFVLKILASPNEYSQMMALISGGSLLKMGKVKDVGSVVKVVSATS